MECFPRVSNHLIVVSHSNDLFASKPCLETAEVNDLYRTTALAWCQQRVGWSIFFSEAEAALRLRRLWYDLLFVFLYNYLCRYHSLQIRLLTSRQSFYCLAVQIAQESSFIGNRQQMSRGFFNNILSQRANIRKSHLNNLVIFRTLRFSSSILMWTLDQRKDACLTIVSLWQQSWGLGRRGDVIPYGWCVDVPSGRIDYLFDSENYTSNLDPLAPTKGELVSSVVVAKAACFHVPDDEPESV